MSISSNSDIDCGDPDIPKHRQQHGTLSTVYTSEVRYSCLTGYTLQGPDRRTCQSNGEWSGSPPQCNRRFIITSTPRLIKINVTRTSDDILYSSLTYNNSVALSVCSLTPPKLQQRTLPHLHGLQRTA